MKKLLLTFAVIIATTLLLVTACKKGSEQIASEEQTTSFSSNRAEADQDRGLVAAFYNTYGPKAETYEIDAARGGTIYLENGKISIPAGAFAIDGRPVTRGPVNVSVLDLPDRGAMAMRGVNTMVGGRILETNGNFQLEANVNGKPVDRKLAEGIKVEVEDQVKNGRPVNLFEGVANNQKQFDWVPVRVPGQPNDIPASSSGSFTFTWPTTGWCNPDWFMFTPGTWSSFTTLQVDLPNNPGPLSNYLGGDGNTTVLFVPEGLNIIIHLYTASPTGVVSYTNSIPVGINGRLLAYSVTSSGYYMATKDITTNSSNPMVETLTFTTTTATDLTDALTALSSY